jgi:HPt (histidine-containing phosphotransfer) domain-containing protein
MANFRKPGGDGSLVSTFADHEIIVPVNKLVRAIARISNPDDDPVARAEEALAQISGEFGDWMIQQCDRLDRARRAVKESGIGKKNRDEIFHAAHDIKGDAATFGFPLAAPAAESLCRVIEHTPDPQRIPLALIDQHVNAVRAIVREYARPDIADIATELSTKLNNVTREYLVHENRHRPDYLDGVFSPPLAPDGGF